MSKLTAQGEDLKSALILLDNLRAKWEAEQMKREEERESRMFALLSSMLGSSAPPHGQHSAVPNIYHSPSMQAGFPSTMPPGVPPTMPPSVPSFSKYSFPYSPGGDDVKRTTHSRLRQYTVASCFIVLLLLHHVSCNTILVRRCSLFLFTMHKSFVDELMSSMSFKLGDKHFTDSHSTET